MKLVLMSLRSYSPRLDVPLVWYGDVPGRDRCLQGSVELKFVLRSAHCVPRHRLSAVPSVNAVHSQSPVRSAVSKRPLGHTNTAVRWLQRGYNHQSWFRRFYEEHLQPRLRIQLSLSHDPQWHLYRRNVHPPHHSWNATIYFVFLLPSSYIQSRVSINKFRVRRSDVTRVSICIYFDCLCDLWLCPDICFVRFIVYRLVE
jgi:hypothetical protein